MINKVFFLILRSFSMFIPSDFCIQLLITAYCVRKIAIKSTYAVKKSHFVKRYHLHHEMKLTLVLIKRNINQHNSQTPLNDGIVTVYLFFLQAIKVCYFF